MSQSNLLVDNFQAGASQFEKSGVTGSVRFLKGFDCHEDPNYLIQTPSPVRDDTNGTPVINLVKWGVDAQPYNPDLFFLDNRGMIYRVVRGQPNLWVHQHQTTESSSGNGLVVYDQYLYYANNANIGRMSLQSPYPTDDNYFATVQTGTVPVNDDVAYNIDVKNSGTVTGSTYTPPVAVSETATNRWTLNPNGAFNLKDPQYGVKLNIIAKGTGNWQVIVHDSNNNQVAEKGVDTTNLPASGVYTFRFDTCWSPVAGEEYHIHIISTVANGTLQTGTLADLETINAYTTFCVLFDYFDCHPMTTYRGQMLTGNGRYLSSFDGAVYDPNKVAIDPGYTVRTLSRDGEYLVIGAWRGSSDNDYTLVTGGRLYYWDGISPTFNFVRQFSGGVVQALFNYRNKLHLVGGTQANLYLGSEPIQQIYDWQFLDRSDTMRVPCQPIAEWNNVMQIGICDETNSLTFPLGVYGYGKIFDALPEAMSLMFVPSGWASNLGGVNKQIGMVASFGVDLFVSWFNGATNGVDLINLSQVPTSVGTVESLILDDGNLAKTKLLLDVVVTHDPLPAGSSITPKYRVDRSSAWVLGNTNSTTGSIRSEFSLPGVRYREVEFGFDSVSSDYFKITGIYINRDLLQSELQKS